MSERQRRLREQRDTLQQKWDIRREKVTRIRKALVIETSVTEILKLEHFLEDEEAAPEPTAPQKEGRKRNLLVESPSFRWVDGLVQ
ncbi:MAG: hypothetical protein ACHBN1_24935 [Heteroscytonema crispum UTEX LB 1556]